MTKTALKLILRWALVNVGSAVDAVVEVANVNFFCTTPGDANPEHCSQPISEGSETPNEKMMDIFNRCVYRETGANLDFSVPFSRHQRALRTAALAPAAAASDEADRSLLHVCADACVCSEACCMQGFCGSSCTCTCPCQGRRLEDENGIISILQGPRFLLPDVHVAENVRAHCTVEVRLLAILLRQENNFCLGSVPGQVQCTPAVISTNHD
jgi:hypothetical protein